MDKIITSMLKDLQQLAEPSLKEFKTTEYIVNFLNKHNIPIDKNLKTGCFGTINADSNRTIAFRADIDALPLDREKTTYKHLCGHHSHTVGLLLALKNIINRKDRLKSNIRYIFQPAEETGGGAKFMIENNALTDVDEIYGLHGYPKMKLGEIGVKKGEVMAGSCIFKLEISGKSTHAAYPNQGNDVVVALSDYINLCQKIISRIKNPVKSGVISFCIINCGSAPNILPENIETEGTFRYFAKEEKELIKNSMEKFLQAVEIGYNVKGNLITSCNNEPVVNNDILSDKLVNILKGNTDFRIIDNFTPEMGAEDFSAYLQMVNGVYIKVGIAENENHPPLHNKNFYVTQEGVKNYIKLWEALSFVDL